MSSLNYQIVKAKSVEDAYRGTKEFAKEAFAHLQEKFDRYINALNKVLDSKESSYIKEKTKKFKELTKIGFEGITLELTKAGRHISHFEYYYNEALKLINDIALIGESLETALKLKDKELYLKELKKLGIDLLSDYSKKIENIKSSSKLTIKMKNEIFKYLNKFSPEQIDKELELLEDIIKAIQTVSGFNSFEIGTKLKNYIPTINPEEYKKETKEYKEEVLEDEITFEENRETKEMEEVKKEIEKIFEKIKLLDEEEYNNYISRFDYKTETSSFRLQAIQNEIKKYYYDLYIIVNEDKIFREELKAIKEPSLEKEINSILVKKYVSKKDYETIYRKYLKLQNHQTDDELKEKLTQAFKEKGYSIISINEEKVERLKNGESVIIDTVYAKDYKVELKIEKDFIKVELIRIVPNGYNATEYDKQKDIEIAEKWCDDYEDLLQSIKEELGIETETKERISPLKGVRYIYTDTLKQEKKEEKMQQQGGLYKRKKI